VASPQEGHATPAVVKKVMVELFEFRTSEVRTEELLAENFSNHYPSQNTVEAIRLALD
jgi:hypothetical protein